MTLDTALSKAESDTLAAVADHLIPAAEGMPSAGEVVDGTRLAFVLRSRPDLAEPLHAALRTDLGADVPGRLAALSATEPDHLAALQLVIVGGYYTDRRVRELLGYSGQLALQIKSWIVPAYIDEGLVDRLLERGPTWRDPATGQRAVAASVPQTFADRFRTTEDRVQGGNDGHDLS